ncbi:hypothetical protein DFH29DRAFT_106995 [Suillus ampliporus]|nr:hypothetical protein DFH29DRAFT_106995 [Suillus ampliporus]
MHDLISSTDTPAMYEHWEYEVAYTIPAILGQTRIVLCDLKAIAHFYAQVTDLCAHALSLMCVGDSGKGETHARWCRVLVLALGEMSNDLLIRSRREEDANGNEREEEKSIIGLLSTSLKIVY